MNCLMRKSNLSFIMFSMMIALFAGVSLVKAAPPWDEVEKLIPSDGVFNGSFGSAVAISGDTAVIGAYHDDDNGMNSGSAYVIDIPSGNQLRKLIATDGSPEDRFGHSVAVEGNLAVVGAIGDRDQGTFTGSAYIFDITTGQQLFKLVATDAAKGDHFGQSVAISGNIAVVGAHFRGDGSPNTGAVYVFDITTGQQIRKLLAPDRAQGDIFGSSVGLSGNLAIVGAAGDDDNGSNSGSVYIFDVSTGNNLRKILASDGSDGDNFGISIAASGNTALIGAKGDSDHGPSTGSAYVFDILTGQQLIKLLASDGAEGDVFGGTVALSGNTALIGAEGHGDNGPRSGSAYLFDMTTGQQIAKLLASDGATTDLFGGSVAVNNDIAIVGAFRDDGVNSDSGSAYVYQQQTTNLLTVSPDPLVGGQSGTFSMTHTLPKEQTWLLYSLKGLGQTFISQLNVTIDLTQPKLAVGPRKTDANGDLQLVLPMPNRQTPLNV